jgi:hypothetical protein
VAAGHDHWGEGVRLDLAAPKPADELVSRHVRQQVVADDEVDLLLRGDLPALRTAFGPDQGPHAEAREELPEDVDALPVAVDDQDGDLLKVDPKFRIEPRHERTSPATQLYANP